MRAVHAWLNIEGERRNVQETFARVGFALTKGAGEGSIEPCPVFVDTCYAIQIEFDEPLVAHGFPKIKIFIEEDVISSYLPHLSLDGYSLTLELIDDSGEQKRIFSNYTGVIRMRFEIGDEEYQSVFLPVYIPNGFEQRNIEAIADFVSKKAHTLLKNKAIDTKLSAYGDGSGEQLAQKLVEFEQIASLYEMHWNYFRSNARYKLKTQGSVESFHKLSSYSAETVRFIATHPEELMPTSNRTGIRFAGRNYLPKHTLVQKNIQSHDIYENQVVCAFLKLVVLNARKLKAQMRALAQNAVPELPDIRSYCDSSVLMLGAVYEQIKTHIVRLDRVLSRLEILIDLYLPLMKVKPISLNSCPKPTATMFAIPSYKAVFNAIVNWFNKPAFELEKEYFVAQNSMKSQLYEYYVLIKIVNHFLDNGWELVQSQGIDWPNKPEYYINPDFDNSFILKKGKSRLRVYYVPVITPEDNGILKLYRASSFFLDNNYKLHGVSAKSPAYTPDYVLEFTEGKRRRFVIADAKYTRMANLMEGDQMMKLLLKYKFGLKTIESSDYVSKIVFFCGRPEFAENADPKLPAITDYPNPKTGARDSEIQVVSLTELSAPQIDNAIFAE